MELRKEKLPNNSLSRKITIKNHKEYSKKLN